MKHSTTRLARLAAAALLAISAAAAADDYGGPVVVTVTGDCTGSGAGVASATVSVTCSGGAPGGTAGGDLGGTFPNPTVDGGSGAVAAWNVNKGGTGATTAPGALTNLGGTTVGQAFFGLTNPSAITFPRVNADNSVTARSAANLRTDLGLGTGDSPTLTGLTLSGLTAGSIPYVGASGVVSQDNGSLSWDDTLKRFAIGTNAPADPYAPDVGVGLYVNQSSALGSRLAEVVLTNDAGKYFGLFHYSAAGGFTALDTNATAGLGIYSQSGPLDIGSPASSTTITAATSAIIYAGTELKLSGGTGGVNVYTNGVYPISLAPNFNGAAGGILAHPHVIRGSVGCCDTLSVFPDRVYISGIKSTLAPGDDTIGLFIDVDNDSLTPTGVTGAYIQNRSRAGSAALSGKGSIGLEISSVNNDTARTVDPFAGYPVGLTEELRLSCGNGTDGTTNCSDAMTFLANPQKFGTLINVLDGSLRTDAGLAHPSFVALPSGTNGYALTWYRATGFTTPAWQIFSTSTTTNGNTLSLDDSAATFNTALAATLGTFGSSTAPDGTLKVTPASASNVGIGVKMFASQTSSLVRIYDESNNIMFSSPPRSSSDHRVKFNWYNTSETTLTNYERMVAYADGTLLNLDSEIGGTGTRRSIAINKSGGRTLIGGSTDDGATLIQLNGAAYGSGDLTLGANAGTTRQLVLNSAAGNVRSLNFDTAGVLRWKWQVGSGAETGSDAGSGAFFSAYTDAGALIDNVISITRASGGTFTIARPLSLSSTLGVTGHTTFEGVTSTGAAGTGKLIYDTSPQFTTGIGIGVAASTGNSLISAEGTCPSGSSGNDVLCAGSSVHRWRMSNNAGTTVQIAGSGDNLSFFAATTSAQLAGIISDELDPGSGKLIFSPGTLNVTAAKTLAATASITLAGTDGVTSTLPATTGDIAAAPAADPTTTTLTNNTNRTPSVTRPTHVTITVDYNTLAASTGRTCDVTVGAATAVPAVYVWNGSATTAQRMVQAYATFVEKNTAYKINCSSATNLTLTAVESPL